MEHIKIADLEPSEVKLLKALEAKKQRVDYLGVEVRGEESAFWDLLRRKYKLDLEVIHHIKGKAIYRPVI